MLSCSDKREAGCSFSEGKGWAPHHRCKAVQGCSPQSRTPGSLVLYCARHTFGTAAYGATGNLAMVMNVMGHTDVRTAMRNLIRCWIRFREAIDQRNLRHKPRHELRVQ